MTIPTRALALSVFLTPLSCQNADAPATNLDQDQGSVDSAALVTPRPIAVTASGDDGNVPENTLDGSMNTRWSAEGDGVWIQYELAELATVANLDIAWHKGDSRQAFFEILVGSTAANLSNVGSFTSSGNTTAFETFDIPDTLAKFVRIVGRGNTQPNNDWTSITEVRVNGVSAADAGVSTDTGIGGTTDAGHTSPPDAGVVADSGTGGGSGTVFEVANDSEFDRIIGDARGGDTIRITASIDELSLRDRQYPISEPLRIVAAQSGIRFRRLSIRNGRGIRVEGFRFASSEENTLFKVENSTHLAIIANEFDCGEMVAEGQSAIVTTQASSDIEIAYNEFKNIRYDGTNSGSFIKTQFDDPNITTRLHIHHNYFHDVEPVLVGDGFDGDSDREAIVFGISDAQDIETHHVVEHNLFEDCDGENEIITIKTSNNVIRYNTFLNNLGSVSVRFGTRTDVYGNFFFANDQNENAFPNDTGGVRVYGSRHRIYNNYFQGLTGRRFRAPIIVDGGDTSDSSGGDGHERPTDVEVVNNTLIDCTFGIGVGTNYSLAPRRTIFANNLIYNTANEMFGITKEANSQYARNIGFGAPPGGTFSTGELWVADPLLMPTDSLLRITASSPAAGYAQPFSYVTDDMDGQPRTGTDVGADEFSSAQVVRRPLTPSDVGPAAAP